MKSPTALRLLVILALGLSVLSACAPAPSPSPTPSPAFTSEEDAFAAAEATYREFIRRQNLLDTSDPRTFEPLYELSSGEFEESDRKAYSAMHADAIKVEGETKLVSFVGTGATAPYNSVTAVVCLDVSDVEVTDSEGVSKVTADRPDVYGLTITFIDERGRFTINSAQLEPDAAC